MKVLALVALLAGAAKAQTTCVDDPSFVDERGLPCSSYANVTSCSDVLGVTALGLQRVYQFCGATCGSCVAAADICEIGVGGTVIDVPVSVDQFDFSQELPEPGLSDTCEWIDTPEGLRQTTNAWGNRPGENQVMGCMAIIKDSMYTDFIMEVDARHEDNDASGILFGIDPADPTMFYKSMMFNDDWLDNPTDGVNGPFIKLNKKNGKPCNGTMTVDTDCYDLLSYVTNDLETSFNASWLPNGALTSHGYIPDAYTSAYDYFDQRSVTSGIAKTVKFTLVVYQGEARVYFVTRSNRVTGTWAKLPADYAGGMVGLWMSAHQATYTSIKIVDLSSGSPFTSPCKVPGATCDTSVGLCLGGPSFAPTTFPTPAPTFFDNCQDPFRHAASDFCPNPEGGAVTTYDVTSVAAWELVQLEPVSENCTWSADATGLSQTSNAWGTYPTSLLLVGCVALTPDTYTDFIAEYEAVHFDNDAWGFAFGWNGVLDHYTAATHNDAWPNNALDGVSGPFTKIRKTTGLACSDTMTVAEACYTTLGYTDANGFSDNGNVKTITPRNKEYEYTHAYAASASFQPAKITLIVQGQEARIVYKSPDTIFEDTPLNNVRMGNKYQPAMTFDLNGYTGGRVGIFMSAHQMIVNNFKITDISDPSNLPTGYCGGAYCDAGVTGLCLGIAASGVCEGAVGAMQVDTQDLTMFEFIDDPALNSACSWGFGPNGYLYQGSNAARNEGTLLGCNALLQAEYTDFVMETWVSNEDNDGIGLNFGWKSLDDHFRVHKINDVWPTALVDYVQMPHWKIRRRLAGVSCEGVMTDATNCYETIAFVDQFGPFHKDISSDAITPAGECGYSQTYLSYDEADRTKMYLIVKQNQVRATYESPLSRRQVTVMNFDLTKYGYSGGRIGLWTFSQAAEFFTISVGELSGASAVTQFCNGDPCSDRTGRCLGSPTLSPTLAPTVTPTVMVTPNVAANEFCQGPVSATATTIVDATDISQFDLVQHDLLTMDCVWTAGADGLSQTSEAWGNAPGDNTLMGCMAVFNGATYTDFIAEIDVTQIDNDGWGMVFGYNSVTDHYLGIAMNDRWPLPAADGIGGPFLKMKKTNANTCLATMDATNNCFDTLSHLDSRGFNKDAMQGATGLGLPREYASSYPYGRGAAFVDTKIVLIVSGQEARLYYPTPPADRFTAWTNLRQKQTMTSVWTFDLAGYTGGQVGVFTYAHQATFSNWKITDLSDPSAITDYCDGDPNLTCDNARGDASTGLCLAVPVSDVCEGPVGDSVTYIDTRVLENFEFVQDPYDVSEPCIWEIGVKGFLKQSAGTGNWNRGLGHLMGCNAIAYNYTFTDMLLQVDLDGDGVEWGAGFNFGWQSIDDHFRLMKMNGGYPSPAADFVEGPFIKVKRKIPGKTCIPVADLTSVDDSCYQTIAFVDSYGAGHDAMPLGAVAPSEYANVYINFDERDVKRLILIIRDQTLRFMYEDVDAGKYLGAFSFDLTPYNYVGGRVGFFTWAQRASFINFVAAPLTGPDAVSTFCYGGTCDERTGLCSSVPTSNPTSRGGDVANAGMCPDPVGGNTVQIDTTDISQFTFIDQEPLSEPCVWETNADGLSQVTNAWGNYPGPDGGPSGNWSEHVTIIGCIALIGTDTYTDFMVEVTATHEDDDAWGFVWGYQQVTGDHIMSIANNDKWPDPAYDGVRGPFIKMKKTNGNECLALMNMSYGCYDTFSYTDYVGRYVSDNTSYFDDTGRFVIDNELVTDIPGEYYRTYPYNVDEVWPTRKMTLIVKDGEARLMVLGPDKTSDAPINNMRQPSKYVSTWSYDLGTYTGGQLGLFVYAHQLTFYDLKITDLSDDNNLPTDYCGANSTCVDSGVCVAVPVPDVCEDPVGAEVIDVTTLDAFEFWQDNGVTSGQCDWQARDLGRGTFMYQSSNAHGSKEGVGCNAMYRGGPYTDFVMQFDADNYDNDGIGFVFGYKSELEHFKIHKRVDAWPAPYDSVGGPNLKVMKRIGQYDCSVSPMNASNACYQAVAFIDKGGAFHQAMPDGAIQPWQYASTFLDYEIGRGVLSASVRMVMMIRDNQLRTYFTPNLNPNLKVGTFAFDMSSWGYTGGRVGVYMYAHQAQFFDIRIAPLSGSNTATEFCANGGTCNTLTGLCE